MLDYDNSAFYYFMLTVLGFYLGPSVLYIIYRVLAALGSSASASRKRKQLTRTSSERNKAKNIVDEGSGLKTLWTFGFILNLVLTVIGLAVCYYLVLLVWDNHEIASFDPYQILGIDMGADDKVIKKAYRMLSLKYHPDKNPGNKQAEEIFMKVAKAYEALTDEASKENWEKYGNPDGKQALEVSIGLPTFLLEKENQNLILVLYLLLLVVVIPVIVGLWYARSKQYGEKNVMYDTYAFYNHMLNENTTIKSLPEVYAGATEFYGIYKTKGLGFQELEKKTKDAQMPKAKYPKVMFSKGNVLLHAHLNQIEMPCKQLQDDLNYMLSRSPELIDALIDLSASHQWLNTTLRIIEFSQYLTQGLFHKDSPFFQLPHFGPQELKAITGGKGSAKTKSLPGYLKIPDEEKKGLSKMDEDEKNDVLACCKIIPDIDVQLDVFVEDEEQIAEGDLVTLKVTMTRQNVEEGQKAPVVHAPRYPKARREIWHALLVNREGKIVGLEKITSQDRVVNHEVKFPVQRAGTYLYKLLLKSDSYCGLDQEHDVRFTAVSAATLPAYVPHPDDVELDNEPTLFEQVMAANVEEDTDSEDEDEDEEPKKKGPQPKAKAPAKNAKKPDDDEESEGSSEEESSDED